MKLSSHYLRLRAQYPHIADREELSVTLDELAAILACTHRNMTLLLKRMGDMGWLEWTPMRGRSHRSTLRFLLPADELLLSEAQELLERQDFRGVLEQLSASAPGGRLSERFRDWLSGTFGHRTVVEGSRRLDLLRFPLSQAVQSLDPVGILFTTDGHLLHQLFDPLVRYHRRTGRVEPHIAHSWEADASRRIWTFHLRKGVLFHHGRELSSADVRYTYERLQRHAPGALFSWVPAGIERVEAPDPVTVRFTLREPNELFLAYAGTNRASIVPADRCEELGEAFARRPVGTGPFQLTHLDETVCVLDAFTPYFQGRAHLDRVELWHVPHSEGGSENGGAPVRSLESFQVLHNYRIPGEHPDAAEWRQIEQGGSAVRFLTFNLLKQGPFANPALREAVLGAMAPLLGRIGGDAVYPAASFVDSCEEGAGAAAVRQPTGGEMDRAPAPEAEVREERRAALRGLGYAGERIILCTITQYERDARQVLSLLQEAGFAAELRLLSAQAFKSEERLHADLLLFSIMLDNDAELRLVDLYQSMQRHLEPAVKETVAALVSEVLRQPRMERRLGLLQAIETVLVSRRLLGLLYGRRLQTAYHTSVQGIAIDSPDRVQFKNIWFRPVDSQP